MLCDWAPERVKRDSRSAKDLEGPSIGVVTTASDGPVDQPLRASDFIKECASGTDGGNFDASTARLCTRAQEGGGRSPLPVVLLKARSCQRAGYQPADEGRLMNDVNHRRDVEIGLLAAVRQDECIGPEAAERRAKERVAASGTSLHVTLLDSGDDGHCWAVVSVAWDRDDVVVSTRYDGG